MPEARRDQIHDQRLPLLQPGTDHQCRGRRGYSEGNGEGIQDRMDKPEPELGSELAIERGFSRAVTVLQGDGQ